MKWCVYILECFHNKLYVGCTSNLKVRLSQHFSGKGAKFTKAFKPLKLVYTQVVNTRKDAYKLEASIKKLSRQNKLSLFQK